MNKDFLELLRAFGSPEVRLFVVRAGAVAGLIKNTLAMGRPQDLADVAALREIQ